MTQSAVNERDLSRKRCEDPGTVYGGISFVVLSDCHLRRMAVLKKKKKKEKDRLRCWRATIMRGKLTVE